MTKTREYTPTTGDSPYMTTDNPQGQYGQRMYKQPPMGTGPMQGMMDVSPLMEAHNRIATVQERSCAPGGRESGRSLSGSTNTHLNAAHDALSKHLGLECSSTSQQESYSAKERRTIAAIKEEIAALSQTVKPRKAQPKTSSYLQEQVKRLNWAELADRTAPLPESLDVTLLLKEFEQLLAVCYDERYKILSFDLG